MRRFSKNILSVYPVSGSGVNSGIPDLHISPGRDKLFSLPEVLYSASSTMGLSTTRAHLVDADFVSCLPVVDMG